MRNHEVTQRQPLLDGQGRISETGWARSPLWEYDRSKITAPGFRIKEWDYYLVMNQEYGAAFTLSDNGYMGVQSVSLLNFKEKWEHTETIVTPFPMGKMKMPSSSGSGNIVFHDRRLRMEFRVEPGKRMISCDFRDFYQGKPFFCEISLEQPDMDLGRGRTHFITIRRSTVCGQKDICPMTAGLTGSALRRIMELWTGEGVFGHTTIHGTGDPGMAHWEKSLLDLISDADLEIRLPLQRTFCSMTGPDINWMTFSSIFRRTIS